MSTYTVTVQIVVEATSYGLAEQAATAAVIRGTAKTNALARSLGVDHLAVEFLAVDVTAGDLVDGSYARALRS